MNSAIAWRYGDICGIDNCRSRLWHTVEGLQYCQNGHQKEGEVEIGEDEYIPGTQGRAIHTAPTSQPAAREERIYYGRKGYALFLKCYQIHLQRQVAWLIRNQHAPERLEIIAKAIWVLYLEARGINSTAIDLDDDSPDEEEENSTDDRNSQAYPSSFLRRSYGLPKWKIPSETQAGSSSEQIKLDHDSDEEIKNDYHDEAEYQSISSSDEAEDDLGGRLANLSLSASRYTKTGSEFVALKLTESVIICYIACRILKVPIFLCDLYRLSRSGEFPYMRAAGGIPYSIRRHLESRYLRIFEPISYPLPGIFYTFCGYVTGLLSTRCKLTVPPIPACGVLLTRFIHDLLLPLEIYQAVAHLEKITGIEFEFQQEIGSKRGYIHPEIKIMALTIVATKLCYGMDGTTRTPTSILEQAAQEIDWNRWKKDIISTWVKEDWEHTDEVTDKNTRMGKISERMPTPSAQQLKLSGRKGVNANPGPFDYNYEDPALWTDERTKRFLDFYEKTWVIRDEEEAKELLPPRHFLDMFPLQTSNREHDSNDAAIDDSFQMTQADRDYQTTMLDANVFEGTDYGYNNQEDNTETAPEPALSVVDNKIRNLQSGTRPINIAASERPEHSLLPGNEYRIHGVYRDLPDFAEDYDELTQVLYVAGAKITGCSVHQLRKAIWNMENLCVNAMQKQ
ncbi:hypothetical protein BZA70DRAFT_296214 [Myxozyma melibiosi]|uniref:RRN7-type domain-containing protein n=1 Tax=Myxozyma melibiosi TaxID=54550 RepID=A0ABR1F3M1_9ASCO